jgi:hypothetical protein
MPATTTPPRFAPHFFKAGEAAWLVRIWTSEAITLRYHEPRHVLRLPSFAPGSARYL